VFPISNPYADTEEGIKKERNKEGKERKKEEGGKSC
jgi:hypothetical protein